MTSKGRKIPPHQEVIEQAARMAMLASPFPLGVCWTNFPIVSIIASRGLYCSATTVFES